MDLASIAPATKTVALGSAAVEVTGLSLRKITQLIVKYPELLALAAGKVELSSLIMSAPDSALAIFALAVVGPSQPHWWQRRGASLEATEDAMIQAFDDAATGQQLDVLATIVDLTFKGERGVPFLKSLLGASPRETPTPSSEPEPEPGEEQSENSTKPSPT